MSCARESVPDGAEPDSKAAIARLREENDRLREQITLLKGAGRHHDNVSTVQAQGARRDIAGTTREWDSAGHGLDRDEVARYSRQIILNSFGATGQGALKQGSVLIVGAGALGSPAALYLAAAGVGRIGIVDRDAVELSNLHRQVLHSERTVGVHKSHSAARAIHALNSGVAVEAHCDGFTPSNAVGLVSRYDLVLDASDNPATRYLISDAAVIAGVPVVSGAALGTDGQATVYNAGPECPCYRCLWPTPPPAASCARCADAGVMGYVTGVIGSIQAGEAIKILSRTGETLARRLLVFDGASALVRVVRLRGRSPDCTTCGQGPRMIRSAEDIAAFDYAAFVGAAPTDAAPPPLQLVPPERRISAVEAARRIKSPGGDPLLLLDVRPRVQFQIASVPGAVSIPYAEIKGNPAAARAAAAGRSGRDIVVMCRRGNDSQRALLALDAAGIEGAVDVEGGIEQWARTVDATLPIY